VLDLAYRIDLPKSEWMEALARDIHRRRGAGDGVLAFELDISPIHSPAYFGDVASTGGIRGFAAHIRRLHESLSSDLYHHILDGGTQCSTIRSRLVELGQRVEDWPVLSHTMSQAEVEDIWAIGTVNPDARAMIFAAPLDSRYTPGGAERELWQKVGIHIAAGARLRTSINGDSHTARSEVPGNADAVLSPNGRALHLEGQAKTEREALRRAVVAVDRARASDYRRGTSQTIDVWQGLLSGEWSLLDWTDTDGSRFFLAIRNDPETAAPKSLTRKEAQVATYVAQGHPYKVVAYELGLSVSTIATHLRKALDKLGLASRSELAWVHGHLVCSGDLHQPEPGADPGR
jgi:DNA-binding CsgD family transcriptional regulator